jgi:hypothetical protein
MLAPLTNGISGPDADHIDWQTTPQAIVDAVEEVFAAIKNRDAEEADQLSDLFEAIKKIAELAGEALEWPLIIGAAGAFAPFAAIGAGYLAAADKVKLDSAPIAFGEGVALGARGASPDYIHDSFWMQYPDTDKFPTDGPLPQGGVIDQYYRNGALVLGYGLGSQLQGQNYPVLIKDLQGGMQAKNDTHLDDSLATLSDPTDGDWDRKTKRGYYIDLASAFVLVHVQTDS